MKKISFCFILLIILFMSILSYAFKAPYIRANNESDNTKYLEFYHDGNNPVVRSTYGEIIFKDPNGLTIFSFTTGGFVTTTTNYLYVYVDANIGNDLVVGGNLYAGQMEASSANAGAIFLWDQVVDANSPDGTEQSASINIDGGQGIKVYSESDGSGTVDTRQFWIYGTTGIVKTFVYQNTTLADDGTVNLPNATGGHVQVTCNGETGLWNVQTNGICTKIVGSSNTAGTDTDTNLCVYDGGTYAIVKNRLGATGRIIIEYKFY